MMPVKIMEVTCTPRTMTVLLSSSLTDRDDSALWSNSSGAHPVGGGGGNHLVFQKTEHDAYFHTNEMNINSMI